MREMEFHAHGERNSQGKGLKALQVNQGNYKRGSGEARGKTTFSCARASIVERRKCEHKEGLKGPPEAEKTERNIKRAPKRVPAADFAILRN